VDQTKPNLELYRAIIGDSKASLICGNIAQFLNENASKATVVENRG